MNTPPQASTTPPGKVYLIGAGPGDPGLITLRGIEILGKADVVLYDFLANPRLLEHARADASIQCVGKHGVKPRDESGQAVWSQEQINDRILELALAGKSVARLKGGDPSIFARAGVEFDAIRSAGVPMEIVPGVTAALAAASFAGAPLTHREQSSAVALLTGRECDKQEAALEFDALAKFPGTLVVYMGVVTAASWSRKLIEAGKAAATPCTIVRRCSLPDQQTTACRLDEIVHVIAKKRIRPPVVFVIGEVARSASASWFEQRPLFGARIVVTRPSGQSRDLTKQLEELGALVIEQPSIEIRPVEDVARDNLDDALSRLDEIDWVVFSSRNGVAFTMQRLAELSLDARAFSRAKIASVGPATTTALNGFGLRADVTASKSDQDGLADELCGSAEQQRFLLVRGSRGRDTLAHLLQRSEAIVEQVVAYESRDVEQLNESVLAQLVKTPPDWIVAASSASAVSAHRLLSPQASQAKWVAISQQTAGALDDLGVRAAAVADTPSNDSIVRAILEHLEYD